jgi:hypothetical protein
MNMAKYILSSNARICEQYHNSRLNDSKVELLLEELGLQGARVDNLLERARSGSSLV